MLNTVSLLLVFNGSLCEYTIYYYFLVCLSVLGHLFPHCVLTQSSKINFDTSIPLVQFPQDRQGVILLEQIEMSIISVCLNDTEPRKNDNHNIR